MIFADPAFVNRMITTSALLTASVFVKARVVAPVIVIVNSLADDRFNVCVPDTEPSAETV